MKKTKVLKVEIVIINLRLAFFFSPFSFSFFFTFSTCYRCFASCQLYDAVERGGACCVCELAKAWWRLSPSHLSSIYVLFLFGAGALP